MSQADNFINVIGEIAQTQAEKHNNRIFPSVCIAQACLESGYGTSIKMVKANAVFGIKVGKAAYKFGEAWKGAGYNTKTKEVYSGVTQVITDYFRAYNSISDSVEDYFDMLCHCKRYKAALNQISPKACITAIKNGGYATDPDYISKIMNIINTHNLTKYDKGKAVIPEEETFSIGKTYTLTANMYIRQEPYGEKVKHECITQDAKKHSYFDEYGAAILEKGTKVTCMAVKKLVNSIWVLIPSGWVCAEENGRAYIK